MSDKQNVLTQTVAVLILLCGIFTAAIGGIVEASGQANTLMADAGMGLDAGEEPRYTVTIVIDAGHGGEDGGTQSAAGMYEKNVNLEIAQILDTMLRANGVSTVMTRTEDILLYDRNADYQGRKKMLDLAARKQIAEEAENAVFVSIHMNSFPESKYRGLQVFYSPHAPQSQSLAYGIQQNTKAHLQPDNERKIKPATSAIYLLDRLKCPAVLVECGFLSNPEEAARFETEEYRQKVAFVLFCSLMSYISEQNA